MYFVGYSASIYWQLLLLYGICLYTNAILFSFFWRISVIWHCRFLFLTLQCDNSQANVELKTVQLWMTE